MSGYVFMVNGSPISWKSRIPPTVALSTTEAEYMALSTATQECLYLRMLLKELGYKQKPTTIFCDNQGAIFLAKNTATKPRTKHINIRHHFIRDCIRNEDIQVEYIDTNNMTADVFTKALPRVKFEKFVKDLGVFRASEGVEKRRVSDALQDSTALEGEDRDGGA
jgi:hypothetical protein